MRLSDLTSVLGAERHGRDIEFSGCTTDSRNLFPEALFVALRGPHFDGHDFVDAVFERGAAAAVLEHPIGGERPSLVVPRHAPGARANRSALAPAFPAPARCRDR